MERAGRPEEDRTDDLAWLRERVRLEELVASVAAGLIGVDPGALEDQIEAGLGQLATALGADGAYFLRGARKREDTVFVEWSARGRGRREADRIPLPPAAQRWWADRLGKGDTVYVHDVQEPGDDPEAADARAVLAGMGVRSIVLVPLPRHRRFSGFVGLVTRGEPTTFPDDVAGLLRVAGECFMSALGQLDASLALEDARRELEHRNHDLERSNEDLERFAYAAAHDLKAPLARIEMALAAVPATAESEELLAVARRGATRMRRLIEDLLAYAAVGSGPPVREAVDLEPLLDEVLADLAPAIAAGGVVVERHPVPVVTGQRGLLTQLLQNLVGNSLKFARHDAPTVVRIDATEEDDGVTIRVADNGIGIDPDQRAEVFGVFTRLHGDDRYPGSGIGLATCAKVVAHHGGRIWAEDGIDGGTAIAVWLPTPA